MRPRRGLPDLRLYAFSETKHVGGSVDAGFGCLHRIELVVYRRRSARKVVDLVDLDTEGKPHHLKARVSKR
jgi:hypothetical protein